jgi:putative ABC transport system permease protein
VALLVGSASELDLVRSVVPRGSAEAAAASAPGVAAPDGRRAASVELHVASRNGDQVGLLRGVTDAATLVHRAVTVTAGREPSGPFEIMVGPLVGARMGLRESALVVGATLVLERREFTVVGHFVAPGTAYEAEIWVRLDDLMLATRREDVSCVVLRLERAEAMSDLQLFATRRVDLEITAVPARELQQAVLASVAPIAELARWLAVLAVVAGAIGCANTMFAAVLARTRELATLRAIGWSPFAVGLGLLQEALLVAFVGGGLGCLGALLVGDIALRYPMGALSLRPDAVSRGIGLSAALASGLLGGLVPAVRAVRLPLLDAISGRA